MAFSFMEGNEAIARGAIAAGCRFFAGYPITPATSIFNAMLQLMPLADGICMQGEDEIASIGFCLGASMAGLKAMTATSGPGISLYSEQISFAIGSEIPLVIVDVQRLGPSTGSATKGADGDIQFLRWNSSGGLPVIVLSPSDIRDCYSLTMHAFNLSERFRTPVFIAANKEISMTKASIDLLSIEIPKQVNRPAGNPEAFLPFEPIDGNKIPGFIPIGHDTLSRQTSSTHGPDGYITTDPEIIEAVRERMRDKLISAVDSFSFYESFIEPDAETILIAYGVTARAAKSVWIELKEKGNPVSLLVLKTLWPVPENVIREHTSNVKRVIVVEMNLGQYVREIERVVPGKKVEFYGRMDGELIRPEQIREVIENG